MFVQCAICGIVDDQNAFFTTGRVTTRLYAENVTYKSTTNIALAGKLCGVLICAIQGQRSPYREVSGMEVYFLTIYFDCHDVLWLALVAFETMADLHNVVLHSYVIYIYIYIYIYIRRVPWLQRWCRQSLCKACSRPSMTREQHWRVVIWECVSIHQQNLKITEGPLYRFEISFS